MDLRIFFVYLQLSFGVIWCWKEPSTTPSMVMVRPPPGTVLYDKPTRIRYTCSGVYMPSFNRLQWLQRKDNVVMTQTWLSDTSDRRQISIYKSLFENDNNTEIFCITKFYDNDNIEQAYNVRSESIKPLLNSTDHQLISWKTPDWVETNITVRVTPDSNSRTYRVGDIVDHVCITDNLPEHAVLQWWHTSPSGFLEYRQSVSYNGEDFVLRKKLTMEDNGTMIYCRTMWFEYNKFYVRSDDITFHVVDEPVTTSTPVPTTTTTTTPAPTTTTPKVTTSSTSARSIVSTTKSTATTEKPKHQATVLPTVAKTSTTTVVLSTLGCISIVLILLGVIYACRHRLTFLSLRMRNRATAYNEVTRPEPLIANGDTTSEEVTINRGHYFN